MSTGNKVAIIGATGVVTLAVLAWLAFGFFGIQSAFTDTEVAEDDPFAESSDDPENPEGSEEFDEAMEEAEAADPVEVDEDMMDGEVVTLVSGMFAGSTRYTVTGDALVLNDGTEQRFLRLEGFESSNGPDLNVYLRAEDGNFVDLGDLKGNIGDQNYEIPTTVDLSVFSTVEIWCVRFGVLFGNAALA